MLNFFILHVKFCTFHPTHLVIDPLISYSTGPESPALRHPLAEEVYLGSSHPDFKRLLSSQLQTPSIVSFSAIPRSDLLSATLFGDYRSDSLGPFGLNIYRHHVEAVGEADGDHQTLCQLPRHWCLPSADGPIWRQAFDRCVHLLPFETYWCHNNDSWTFCTDRVTSFLK